MCRYHCFLSVLYTSFSFKSYRYPFFLNSVEVILVTMLCSFLLMDLISNFSFFNSFFSTSHLLLFILPISLFLLIQSSNHVIWCHFFLQSPIFNPQLSPVLYSLPSVQLYCSSSCFSFPLPSYLFSFYSTFYLSF